MTVAALSGGFIRFSPDALIGHVPEVLTALGTDIGSVSKLIVTHLHGDNLRVIEGEADVAPGVTALPMPAHTFGYTGYMLKSGTDSLLVWGDIIHVPAVKRARPEVTILFDTDNEQAATTRANLMTALADNGQRVSRMHVLFQAVGYLDIMGDGSHFDPAPWGYLRTGEALYQDSNLRRNVAFDGSLMACRPVLAH